MSKKIIVIVVLLIASLIAGIIIMTPARTPEMKFCDQFIKAVDKGDVSKLDTMIISEFSSYALPSIEDEPDSSDIIESLDLNMWNIVSSDSTAKEISKIYIESYKIDISPTTLVDEGLVEAELVLGADYVTIDNETKTVYASEKLTLIEYRGDFVIFGISKGYW